MPAFAVRRNGVEYLPANLAEPDAVLQRLRDVEYMLRRSKIDDRVELLAEINRFVEIAGISGPLKIRIIDLINCGCSQTDQ